MAYVWLLKFGVNADNKLVNIADVPSGKSDLICPYCGVKLVAKKGQVKEHHFAHTGQTCCSVTVKREFPTLPLYDNFNIELSGQALQLLKLLWKSCGQNGWSIPFSGELKPLIKAKLLQKNPYQNPPGYEFTQLGQIPVGALPLKEFNQIQEPLLLKKLADIERQVKLAKVLKALDLKERSIDLWLYRTQLKRILEHRLYYLEVKTDSETLSKIGITKRTIEERMVEIRRDLYCHYKTVELKVLGTWEHRGNVELYFKHRYQPLNYRLGSLTEYYKFGTEASAVLNDLEQMYLKCLSQVEFDILIEDDKLAPARVENHCL
ncbi:MULTISPECIES: competence protein CoiA family protein [unclassified Coleofasciculus]|uniref:competence protein CoiA family protein n=1 Tax=Cyanophyceae TaxID=3028117 RepID=UPI0018F0510A|nr:MULTISPECIES: competence protein CoiA family protein [unclassified Coleofasciculus]